MSSTFLCLRNLEESIPFITVKGGEKYRKPREGPCKKKTKGVHKITNTDWYTDKERNRAKSTEKGTIPMSSLWIRETRGKRGKTNFGCVTNNLCGSNYGQLITWYSALATLPID